MTTRLITTITYATGRTEADVHDWPDWDPDTAASCMRARRHVLPDKTTRRAAYDVPLRDIDHAAGIARIHHEWV
ncbi:hypothetical protein [Brachybacterium kimchii]|uniref:Uncharacterized protein n=1 Tax=Brachybacterium kimchii TaxID=2942909 RepID=A0ABY4NBA4_9MICO|nr:hypothetical protein [Brachybacterium kimchii]UQN31817.1 hypothetical protein M4486_19700 [Brachybacterium kimchii]